MGPKIIGIFLVWFAVFIPNQLCSQDKTPMLEMVNALRSTGCYCGKEYMPPAPPLHWNNTLKKAAQAHAGDMLEKQYFSHKGKDGRKVDQRVEDLGYDWKQVGENIAMGPSDVVEVMRGWKASPGHCRNLMDPGFREMGAGQEGNYWVQVFAASFRK